MIGDKLFRIFDGEDCKLSDFIEKTALLDKEFHDSYAAVVFESPEKADKLEWDLPNLLDLYASLAFLIGFVIASEIEITQTDALSEIKVISSMMKEGNVLPYFPVTMGL